MMNKIPGIASQMQIHENKLDLSFSEAYDNQRVVDAYERLLLEVINGDQSLFVRRDEVEAAGTGLIVLLLLGNQRMKRLSLMLLVHGDQFPLFL